MIVCEVTSYLQVKDSSMFLEKGTILKSFSWDKHLLISPITFGEEKVL
jgi:hypothetical protein